MRLADDVDFVPGMALWDSNGKEVKEYEVCDHYGNPWIEVDRHTGGLISHFYSSYKNWELDYYSPTNYCFVCERHIKPNLPRPKNKDYGMMWGSGLFFRARGNFGSTIFDPPGNDQFLEIVICDDCVVERQDRLRYYGENTHDNQGPPYG